jgi:hypothetical protein
MLCPLSFSSAAAGAAREVRSGMDILRQEIVSRFLVKLFYTSFHRRQVDLKKAGELENG